VAGFCDNINEPSASVKDEEFLGSFSDSQLLNKSAAP
jgi:hypothetical protein